MGGLWTRFMRQLCGGNPLGRQSLAHPSEGGAAAASPIGALMSRHILRDGELVLLILRPSRWFIPLVSLPWMAVVLIAMILALVFREKLQIRSPQAIELAGFLIAGRLMWAVLQWMGRLYILTDMRILRLSGVMSVEVFDCPLRRVARTLLERTFKERLCRIGTIVIIPDDEQFGLGQWQMVARPRDVREQVMAAIRKAKQGGRGE